MGGGFGVTAAWLLTLAFQRFCVPDHLQNPVALMLVVGVFTLSNMVQHESGLLTVTIMGIALANQRNVHIRHIVEFKENLRVLVISGLFILLAARLQLAEVMQLQPGIGTGVSSRAGVGGAPAVRNGRLCRIEAHVERTPIPRLDGAARHCGRRGRLGIRAPTRRGRPPASPGLVPVVFLVIVGTVTLDGLTAGPLANALNLSKPNPQGALFVGAHPLARALAQAVQREGLTVLLADTNWENLAAARLEGLPTYHGNVLSEEARDELELTGIGRLVALTPNQEVNALAAMHFIEFFGRSEVYQVQVQY